ncbi:hypothetical protein ZIOFF_062781 [Zingiber officinale]|uniref:Uncharacterized protein n=1 Tax=Zingiber officinale TaxID=94328 RepID=A0A8J5F5X5_ZINOF|nr:hypothetical protein ZIOFF_062781 [Zingiber officinale]
MKKIKPNKKPRPTKVNQLEHVCFHYNKLGHWRCNCKEYLAQTGKEVGYSNGGRCRELIDGWCDEMTVVVRVGTPTFFMHRKREDSEMTHVTTVTPTLPLTLRQFEETVDAKDIHIHLQGLYGAQTHSVRHATIKELMIAYMRDGASVHEHGVKMIELIEKLLSLDLVIPHELSTDIILLSLPSSFDNFMVNFNMNKLEATLEELVNMLANYEATMKKKKICFPCGFIFWIQERTQDKGKEAFCPYKED